MTDTPNDEAPRKCKAHKRSGKPCGNAPVKGHLVCRMHGASSPQAKARVARDETAAEIRKTMVTLYGEAGIPAIGNPLEELQKLAAEVVAWKDLLREHVEQLKNYRYEGEAAEQIRGEVILFERALDRCGTVLGLIAKLNIDERLAAIEELKVQKLLKAVNHTLDFLGLSVDEQLRANAELARQLRSVS